METIIERILSGRVVEFFCHDEAYLIQQENNKGWNYLSLWRIRPDSTCLCRVFFDIFDGVSEETIRELFAQPCADEHTVQELLQSPEIEWKW